MTRNKLALVVVAAVLLLLTAGCSEWDSSTEPTGTLFEVSARVTDQDTGRPVTTAVLDFDVDGDSDRGVVVDGDGWTKIVQLHLRSDASNDPQEINLTIRGGIAYGVVSGSYPLTLEYNPRAGEHVPTALVLIRRTP